MDGKLPRSAHVSQAWRIHDIAPEFHLVDVWALPTPGGADDFPRLVELMSSLDPATFRSGLVRFLVDARYKLGDVFGWDDESKGVGGRVSSLVERLPEDLRGTPVPPEALKALPAEPLYVIENEMAAEIANQTVHGVLHVGWVEDDDGIYRGQLAILVKMNGVFGKAYLAAIQPFRHLFVYPALMSEIGARWDATSASVDLRSSSP